MVSFSLKDKSDLPDHIDHLQPVESQWNQVKASAVCLLFVPGLKDTEAAEIVFIRRSLHTSSHRGQIGFPGGHREVQDANPKITALRELEEEIGVPPSQVSILGCLPCQLSLRGTTVVPIVAYSPFHPRDFVLQESEVAGTFTVPWQRLKITQAENFQFTLFGRKNRSHLYRYQDNLIWGLTARILHSANFS